MNESMAQISVIIPCYNCGATIKRAFDSILIQTVKPKEIIFVDDFSTDNTLSVIEEIKKDHADLDITTIELLVNNGPAHARNAGWKIAVSKYIAFLDADDSWGEYKLYHQYGWLLQNPDVDLCGHKCEEQGVKSIVLDGTPVFQKTTKLGLLLSNRFQTPSVILKRNIALRFDESKKYSEDYDLWLSIVFSGGVAAHSSSVLAYLHKPPFGSSGLSANLMAMQSGEVENFRSLLRENKINKFTFIFVVIYSYTKFLRRYIKTYISSKLVR